MSNHIHLMVKSENLSQHIHNIATSYAMWFNHKYERCGHFFQDRFKSEVIEDEGYLLQCFRYILRNPVKAGMCIHPAEYRWSSYHDCYTLTGSFVYTEFLEDFFDGQKDFENFISADSSEQFLDIPQIIQPTDSQVRDILEQKLNGKIMTELSKSDRQFILQEIYKDTHASFRQLSRITGIGINIVRKITH